MVGSTTSITFAARNSMNIQRASYSFTFSDLQHSVRLNSGKIGDFAYVIPTIS
jgi:hypothetical protein